MWAETRTTNRKRKDCVIFVKVDHFFFGLLLFAGATFPPHACTMGTQATTAQLNALTSLTTHHACLFSCLLNTSSRGALQRLAVAADTHTDALWPSNLRLEVRMVGWSTQTSCRCRLELTGCCSGRTFTQTCTAGLMINSKLLINRYSFPSPTLPPLPLPVDPAPPLPAPPPLPSLLQPALASAASWSQLGPCTSWSGRRSGSCRWW